MAARGQLPEQGEVLVLYGDTPLVTADTLAELLAARRADDAAVAVLGFRPPDPAGYGRLALDRDGLAAIVEERHADPVLRREGACNAGIMAFDAARLGALLDALEVKQPKGEYYLTDVVEHARASGWPCRALGGAVRGGARHQLAGAARAPPRRSCSSGCARAAMAAGVTLIAPETVFLAADTELAAGVEIGPYVVFGPGVAVARRRAHPAVLPSRGRADRRARRDRPVRAAAPRRRRSARAPRSATSSRSRTRRSSAGAKANHLSYLGDAHVGAKCQHRRRHDHLQLRRLRQASHRDRRGRRSSARTRRWSRR